MLICEVKERAVNLKSFEGKKLSTASFGRRLNKYSRQIGYKITPYDLRHSFALLYLRNGGNVFTLQRTREPLI